MAWNGKARHGVSLVYRVGGILGEMRFTNLATDEIRDTLEHWGRPHDITASKENPESKEEDTKEEAQRITNILRIQHGFRPLVFNRQPRPRVVTKYDLEIDLIRKALKGFCPSLSVRRGSGTAYGWIDIQGSGDFGNFNDEEKRALEKFGLNCGGNFSHVSPDDRRHYVEKAAEMLGGIPPELKHDYEETDRYREEMRKKAEERRKEKTENSHDQPRPNERKTEPSEEAPSYIY